MSITIDAGAAFRHAGGIFHEVGGAINSGRTAVEQLFKGDIGGALQSFGKIFDGAERVVTAVVDAPGLTVNLRT